MRNNIHQLSRVLKNHRSLITLGVTLLLFVISGILLAYLLRDMNWKLIRRNSLIALVPILALTMLGTLIYTLLVYLLIRGSGYATTLWKAYLTLSASLTANYLTPVKVGIPLRVYLYNELLGIPMDTGAALITVEAIVGILVPAFLAAVGTAFLFPDLGLGAPIMLIILLLVVLLLILCLPVKRLRYLNRPPLPHLTARLMHFVERFQSALCHIPSAAIIGAVILDLLMLATQTLCFWLVLGIFGPAPSFLALLAVFTISITSGNLSMIPMGLGVRDASLTILLVQLGISREVALSAAIIQRLFSPGWPLLLGLISSNILGIQIISSPRGKTTENDKS